LIELDDDPVAPEMQESVELDRSSVHRRTLSYPRTFAPLPQSDIEAQAQCFDNRDLPDPYLAETFSAKVTTALDLIKTVPWVRKAIPVTLIVLSTCLISICGELLIGSIDHFVDHSPISKTMVGLIILPVVGNASELISGTMFAYRKQMDLAFAVCIGSAIQMALLVAPLVVLLGWTLGREMSLNFSLFEAITLVASTVMFFSLVFDERCSTIKGASLLAGYAIIRYAICARHSRRY
jgi:Ca2+:H+ antiporter